MGIHKFAISLLTQKLFYLQIRYCNHVFYITSNIVCLVTLHTLLHYNMIYLLVHIKTCFTFPANESTSAVVMVLIEGGLPIVNDIYAALTSSPKVPLLVVKDSGRLADVFIEIMELYEHSRPNRYRLFLRKT